MSYENKMLQMKKLLSKKQPDSKAAGKPVFIKPDKPIYTEMWQEAGLELLENDFGVLFQRKVEYSYDYQHGNFQLGELFDALESWETSGIEHPFRATEEERLVFFDTETTGLKGTGTHIFLIGILEDTGRNFELTQYVLADPSNETAFLFESKFWQGGQTVITYNGKSFDWPQLEMRWTLNKPHLPPLKSQRQIDLLHSSKRIWRDELEGMKLTKVEMEKLGFERIGDIPGHLAPIIYFDAVKSGNPASLLKVLKHNEWDLLSLITLYIHSTALLVNNSFQTSISSTNIGKWYKDLKFEEMSIEILEKVVSQFEPKDVGVAHYYLGQHYKKQKNFERAIESFLTAIPFITTRMQEDAYMQLAIVYEHHVKNIASALEATKNGLAIIKQQHIIKSEATYKRILGWEKRYDRLQNKYISRGSANYDKH